MIPKVLVSNPETEFITRIQGLIPTTWDKHSFWMGAGFSFAKSFMSTNPDSLSPYLLLEARAAFLMSLLDTQRDTYLAGVSPLSSLLFFLRTRQQVLSSLSFENHLKEYTHRILPKASALGTYSQIVIWDQDSVEHLNKLSLHGSIYLASTVSLPEAPGGFLVEQKWSYAENSEIGSFYLLHATR